MINRIVCKACHRARIHRSGSAALPTTFSHVSDPTMSGASRELLHGVVGASPTGRFVLHLAKSRVMAYDSPTKFVLQVCASLLTPTDVVSCSFT
jgi:hypothetical protein